MSPRTPLCLMLLSLSLTGCGVLFPEPPERIVLTKTEVRERPLILDPICPPAPNPPPKPQDRNTGAKEAASFWNEYGAWAMACADLNQALDAILRPSKEELRPTQ